jgi:hypothetical protein
LFLYIAIGGHVARAAFKKFDKNNDGQYLNIKEIMELVKILQSKSNGENKIHTKSSQNAMFDDGNNNLEEPDSLIEPNHNIQVEKNEDLAENYTNFKEFAELNNQCEPNYGFNHAIIRSNENNFENQESEYNFDLRVNYGFAQQENLPNNDPNNTLWQKSGYGFNPNFE